MFKNIFNDQGIALIMVLIMLILVGTLTAALMNFGVFNIRFGGNEVERTQSLYAADAGVEFTKNWMNNAHTEDIENLINGPDEYFLNKEYSIKNNNSFKIEIATENDSGSDITFISTGTNSEGYKSKIKFSVASEPGEGKSTIINEVETKEGIYEYIDLNGGPSSLDDEDPDSDEFKGSDMAVLDLPTWEEVLHDEYNILNYDVDTDTYSEKTVGSDGLIGETEFEKLSYNNQIKDDIENDYQYITTDDDYNEVEIGDELGTHGNQVINDSIVIINGSLKVLGNIELNNSLLIVRGTMTFGGSFTTNESQVFVFNENNEDIAVKTNGNPTVNYTPVTDYGAHPFNYGNSNWVEEIVKNGIRNYFVANDWRQIK